MAEKNFLLKGTAGEARRGEDIRSEAASYAPYGMKEAVERLQPELQVAVEKLCALPQEVCLGDHGVVALKMHPEDGWDSHYPAEILETYGLRHLGSRPIKREAQKSHAWEGTGSSEAPEAPDVPEGEVATEIYLAGRRSSFEKWAADFRNGPSTEVAESAQWIDSIAVPTAADKLHGIEQAEIVADGRAVEFVLHASTEDADILAAFKKLAAQHGAAVQFDRQLCVSGLCFIPGIANDDQLARLVDFPYLRSVRPLGRMRPAKPDKMVRD